MRRHRLAVGVVLVLAVGLTMAVGPAVGHAGTGEHATDTMGESDGECGFPLTVEDNTGTTVEIDQEPEEVVTLLPSVAQQIWEMDAEEKVTGMPVKPWTSYLEGSENRTHVLQFDESAGLSLPNTEVIVDMDPDIVLAPNEVPEDSVTELRDAGLTVYYYERPPDLEGLKDLIDRTGRLIGECEAASSVITEMNETIDLVESAVEGEDRPKAFYDSGFSTTVTEGSIQHELLTLAGVENVAADFDTIQVNPEQVVAADPEWVITTEGGQLSDFQGYNQTTALQEDRIVRVDPNLFSQRGPRYMDVLENLTETFHPEALQQARDSRNENPANDSMDDSTDDSVDDPMDDSANESMDGQADEDGSGAGLTVAAAVLALSAVVVLARRRH